MDYYSIASPEPDYVLCLFFSDWLEEHGRECEARVLRWLIHNKLWPELSFCTLVAWWHASEYWGESESMRHWLPRGCVPRPTPWHAAMEADLSVAVGGCLLRTEDAILRCDNAMVDALEWACRNVDLGKVPQESLPREIALS